MNDSTPVWGWIVKGLGGAINLVASQTRDNPGVTEHWFEELRKLLVRLAHLVDELDKNRPKSQ